MKANCGHLSSEKLYQTHWVMQTSKMRESSTWTLQHIEQTLRTPTSTTTLGTGISTPSSCLTIRKQRQSSMTVQIFCIKTDAEIAPNINSKSRTKVTIVKRFMLVLTPGRTESTASTTLIASWHGGIRKANTTSKIIHLGARMTNPLGCPRMPDVPGTALQRKSSVEVVCPFGPFIPSHNLITFGTVHLHVGN